MAPPRRPLGDARADQLLALLLEPRPALQPPLLLLAGLAGRRSRPRWGRAGRGRRYCGLGGNGGRPTWGMRVEPDQGVTLYKM